MVTAGSPTRLDPGAIVTRFLEAVQNDDIDFARDVLDENIVYQNVGLPTIRGKQAVLRLFGALENTSFGFEVDVQRTTTNGYTVMNERYDALSLGSLRTQFWVCGVFEVSERGTITLWRDYFDFAAVSRAFLRGLIGIVVPSLRARF